MKIDNLTKKCTRCKKDKSIDNFILTKLPKMFIIYYTEQLSIEYYEQQQKTQLTKILLNNEEKTKHKNL